MIETKHFGKLREDLNKRVYYWKINANFVAGIPDAYMSGMLRDLWCEGKRYPKLPGVVDLTNPDTTSKLQQDWLKARHAEGRNVSMLVFTDAEGHLLLHGLEWMLPIPREEFLARAKTRKEIADELVEYLGEIPSVRSPRSTRRRGLRRSRA